MAVRGFLWRVMAMMSWSGTFYSPRWVAAEWRSWGVRPMRVSMRTRTQS
ncbi:hypothetical protein [Actinomadura madurae]|nr:hypothetical protein [Actinomadura madurae]MCP9952329.1 hypothetical protein [Actinomadura madurae]MCP9969098.1 hypothetical protein [Actinomadura madurae]MCP9981570.1 hypothetical protein [Actinomadura madurae]MCQ0006922.1 hypothetical protein [Actinomadura madurae]MCQ0017769.1 hypothetical protein [Actinomadura madurae]